MTDRHTPPIYRDQEMRQREIILRTRGGRMIVVAGLAGAVILGFVSIVLAHVGHHIVG